MSHWSLIWKIPVAIVAAFIGALGANQLGWSGADLLVNAPIMGAIENTITATIFVASLVLVFGTAFAIYRVAKHVLWLAAPVFVYAAAVLGAWNGYLSDFDYTRMQALRHGYANAYAIEHMSLRGRYRTCTEGSVQLADGAGEVCQHALAAAPGEPIPGSEHRCGLLGLFGCFYTAPQ
jgi:hypothetical protein